VSAAIWREVAGWTLLAILRMLFSRFGSIMFDGMVEGERKREGEDATQSQEMRREMGDARQSQEKGRKMGDSK